MADYTAYYSDEDFDRMAAQLTDKNGASFDMLFSIAERSLRRTVKKLCRLHPEYEEDVMLEIHMKLIKTAVPKFLLRDGAGKPLNRDPEGFLRWMYTVARHTAINFFQSFERYNGRIVRSDDDGDILANLEDTGQSVEEAVEADEQSLEHRKLLNDALNSVLLSGNSIYKILAWLAFSVTMLGVIDRSKVAAIIDNEFSQTTLGGMYDILTAAVGRISWLKPSDEADRRVREKLAESFDGKRPYSEIKFSEFYMKKGAVSTISDWINKVDSKLSRDMQERMRGALSQ